jgi:hypothetical protein
VFSHTKDSHSDVKDLAVKSCQGQTFHLICPERQ